MSYVPERGDIVKANFDPQAGHEQAGLRPALVLSRKEFNSASNLAVFCPITGRSKGYPYEVALPPDLPVYGVILVDHVKTLDWRARQASFFTKAPKSVLTDVQAKLKTLLQ